MTDKNKKTVAYLRVSTIDQDIQKNKASILNFANENSLGKVHFIEEKVSGKVPWRKRKIAEILQELERGDNIIVSELSRLGRSMLECMEILAVASEKHINIYALKGNWRLDQSVQSKIVAVVFSMASEIEHDLISKRTTEALAVKKAQGVSLGRPKGIGTSKLDKSRVEIEALLKNGTTQKFIAGRYDTTQSNLHRWLTKNMLIKPKVKIRQI